ncbi:MAG: cupredoxin domain-containing protein [Longimicrobiales bacterium]
MTARRGPTPARPGWRAGVVLFASLLVLAACSDLGETEPRILVLGTDTLVIPDSIDLVEVRVGGEPGTGFEPATPVARVGDLVRFVAADGRTHAVAFDGASLTVDRRAFLETTGQLRGLPLLTEDAAWIVSLEGAPPGDYYFTCVTHGARGRLVVQARAAR